MIAVADTMHPPFTTVPARFSPPAASSDQSTHEVDPGRLGNAGIGRGVPRWVNRARARCPEHIRPQDTATGRRNRYIEDLVAVARRADAGLRAANALRASGRGSSRQRLVDSQERVLDTGPQGVAAGVRACRIEDSEIERLNPGTVL